MYGHEKELRITGLQMTDSFLDRTALADLHDAAGPEFANVLFTQIRADFARLHDDALAKLREYAPNSAPEFDATRRVAHEMKGLALTVGATALAKACAETENLAHEKDMTALTRVLPEVIALCDRVRIELEQCIAGVE
jgi:HPt (histidine-containing phosphotransfer) domain-containing protein